MKPEACQTMADVRLGVDALDREIVTLLAKRMRFIGAAARIKPSRELIRDEARKAEVIENAAAHALASGVPEQLIRDLFEILVEGSISCEYEHFDARNQKPKPR